MTDHANERVPEPARRAPRSGARSIDRALRGSWLGRRSTSLRKVSPGVYTLARSIYQRILLRGRGGLSPYQATALEAFLASTTPELREHGVLEVGSDLDTLVIRELARRGVPRVLGINPALSHEAAAAATATLPEGSELRSVDLLRAGFTEHSFGAIFSVAVFEHLNDFDACLREMYRLLVPGGRVYAAFGPIWSSSLGHHVFADRGNIQLRHWDPKLNPVDDHAHLLLERNEMAAGIAKSRGPVVAEAAAEWIYDSTDVNRLFYDDYVAAFQRSPLTLVRITPEREHVPADRLQRLRAKHPRQGTFDVRNAEVVLERPR